MKVAMLSTIHTVKDHRIYYKETMALSKYHDVIIIARGDENKIQTESGIKLIEFKGKLTIINHIFNCFNCLKIAINNKADVYHCHEPSSLFIGCLVKIIYKSKLVYDRHDYYPNMIKEKFDRMGLSIISPMIYNLEKISEKLMIKYFANKMIVPDNEMKKRFKNSIVIHNYPTEIKGKIRNGYNFTYLGMLDHRKIPESINIINEIAREYPHIVYEIGGQALDKNLIPENTKNIKYRGVIPHSKINDFLNGASFGMCLYDKINRYENAVSTKTYEYIGSGIPVIASKTKGIR